MLPRPPQFAILLVSVALLVGCATQQQPTATTLPSTDRVPLVLTDQTRDTLVAHSANDDEVMASALESIQDSGNVIYIDFQGYIYDKDGSIYTVDGAPLQFSFKSIVKANSLHNLASLQADRLEYWAIRNTSPADLPEGFKHMVLIPNVLGVEATGINGGAIPATPMIRQADAAERAAILQGLGTLAAARGSAWATKYRAFSDGTVGLITATGKEIVGRVTGTTVIENGISTGVNALERTLVTTEGKTEKVVTPVVEIEPVE